MSDASDAISYNDYGTNDTTFVSGLYQFTAVVLFVLLAGQLLFPSNYILPLDRRTSSVCCAVFVYISHKFLLKSDTDVDLLEAVDFDVLLLLSAIMIINYIVLHLKETQSTIKIIQNRMHANPVSGFWVVSFASLAISPFLTNDGVCLLFVAPILSAFETIDEIEDTTPSTASRAESGPLLPTAGNFKLKRTDAIWYMLSLACSANIGSALTYTGNPQNMIVASDSIDVLPPWKFLLFMMLPVTFSWLLSTYYLQYCWICQREAQELEKRDQGIYLSQFCPGFKILTRYPTSSSKSTASNKLSLGDLSDDEEAAYSQVVGTGSRTRPRSNSQGSGSGTPRSSKNSKSAASAFTTKKPISTAFIFVQKIGKIVTSPYPYLLLIIVAVMIVMIFVDVMAISGLIVVFAMIMVCTVVLGNHWRSRVDATEHSPIIELSLDERERQLEDFFEDMFGSIDYNLLFIFGGLFVVVANLEGTGIPKTFWDMIAGDNAFQNSSSMVGICVFVALASQFLGNVAVCQLAKPRIEPLDDDTRRLAWALVSFVSTVAGNLTLTGSAANLIVAEQAMRIDRENTLDFFRHIKACFVVCVISCVVGGGLIVMADALMGNW
eukprot:GSChrysophyteH2.ASY1.ANO1.699.1 assembled CDS